MDNVNCLMEKVEPKERQHILREILGSSVYHKIWSFSQSELEMEAAAIDTFVNCDPQASWERVALSLYHCHQMAAVEEVRSHLPPRGESQVFICTIAV